MAKFYIDQHGCAKNQTDGELLAGYLCKNGFELVTQPNLAEFILINSCGFIESAKKESIDAVYSIKKAYPDAKIILCGCLAERYAAELLESMPELDGVFGNGDLTKITEYIKQNQRKPCVYQQSGISEGERPYIYNYKASAFVKITEGCSNHCSFCAIPLIRGELRSRKWQNIIKEITDFVQNGVYEINLIGQDLAAYGTGATDKENVLSLQKECKNTELSPLALLFTLIDKIPGDFIVRPLYIHPDHFNTDILKIIKNSKKFISYFDIPFQSGDNNIIKAMNRTGTFEGYVKLINTIKTELPDCVLRTTFLTGFPGESEEAAENTKRFLKQIEPHWSGCFAYSREEGTPAYDYKKRVSKKCSQKRADELEIIQSEITLKKLEKYIGQEVDVLVEEIIHNDESISEDSTEGLAIGRAWFQAPEVDGCVVIRYDLDNKEMRGSIKEGNVVTVKILAVTGVDLDARFIKLRKAFDVNSKKIYLS